MESKESCSLGPFDRTGRFPFWHWGVWHCPPQPGVGPFHRLWDAQPPHPRGSDVIWKERKWKRCQDSSLPRKEWKEMRWEAVFAMNHSQKMVYCRDIYESEARMRSTPDLLTEVVQGRNQQERILHLLLEKMSVPPQEFQLPFDNDC